MVKSLTIYSGWQPTLEKEKGFGGKHMHMTNKNGLQFEQSYQRIISAKAFRVKIQPKWSTQLLRILRESTINYDDDT